MGTERNECIRAKNNLKTAVEDATRKAVADTLDQVCLEVEAQREVQRREMRESLKMAEAQYLALDAVGIVRANCLKEGFKVFWDLAVR